MNDYERLEKTMLLTTLFDKDKLRFIPAMDFHKDCLKDEKNKKIIKIHRQAIYCCITGLIAGLVSDEEVKKEADMDKIVDIFLSHKGNVSLNETDFNDLLK